jgi:hypothetical protein
MKPILILSLLLALFLGGCYELSNPYEVGTPAYDLWWNQQHLQRRMDQMERNQQYQQQARRPLWDDDGYYRY